ncbi:MAG: hypothetical protein EPN22_17390 [Nitrospirae bacterium]|nr:MAG: hypothetical protein EPN22_17390 [Nitrospirota bacterium]
MAIRGKLVLLEQMRDSKHWKRRIFELEAEIKALDKHVDPSTQRADQFCAADCRRDELLDLSSRAEIKGSPGAPEKQLQNFLLGTVGECLYNADLPRDTVCSWVAKILVFCFPISRPETGEKLENYVETHAEALLEQWRVLRAKPGYAAPSAKSRQLSDKDVLPHPR